MNWAPYAQYRAVDTAWLGKVPIHWETRNPKSLFRLRREPAHSDDRQLTASQSDGVVYQDEYMEKRGTRVVQVIEGQAGLKHVAAGDFVISLRSFQGGIEYSAAAGKISPAYTILEPDSDVDRRYFVYLLKSDGFVQELRSTSNQLRDGQSLGLEHFAQVRVPFPPKSEQHAIARFLDREAAKIDALIDKQDQLIATLREDRAATIAHAVTKGLNPDVEMKESDAPWIGEIPAHWILAKVKHGFSVTLGKMYQGETKSPEDIELPHLKAGSVTENGLNLADPMMCWFTPSEARSLTLRAGDVLVVEGGAIGRCAVLKEDLQGWGFQKSLNRVRATNGDCPDFLAYLIEVATLSGHVSILCGKATIPHFTAEKLAELEWPHPSINEQKEIVDFLDSRCANIDALINKSTEMIKVLREYRSGLITNAVTGKIDVREAM